MNSTVKRPRFLDLTKIRLPLPGIVSILHRISGVFMILAIPVCIWLLELAVTDQAAFTQAAAIADSLLFKLAAAVILWSLCHHLVAGIRYLLLDIDVWVERKQARQSAVGVFIVSILLTIGLLGVIW
ncbi:MAG: succinate dehydrogenase, cytochrome b556 subunit [Sedimenticolaceae bacterium]|nr:succinate dehydrogenase, cytochrome b556 subunit [Sedimenticolaceae bacterium]